LIDPLGNLIDAFSKAFRSNSAATMENFDELLDGLRKASAIRNVLCHCSWRSPDGHGRSVPFFVRMVFDTPIDITFLEGRQARVAAGHGFFPRMQTSSMLSLDKVIAGARVGGAHDLSIQSYRVLTLRGHGGRPERPGKLRFPEATGVVFY
jgi:hypothetical protein